MTTIRKQISRTLNVSYNLVCIWKQTMLDTWGKARATLRTEKMLLCTQLQLMLMNKHNYWEVVPFVAWCGQLTDDINKLVIYFNIKNKELKSMHIVQPVKKWYTNISSPYSSDTVDLCSVAVLDSELEILIVVGTQICSVDSAMIKTII